MFYSIYTHIYADRYLHMYNVLTLPEHKLINQQQSGIIYSYSPPSVLMLRPFLWMEHRRTGQNPPCGPSAVLTTRKMHFFHPKHGIVYLFIFIYY
jgi:hypothetical protein